MIVSGMLLLFRTQKVSSTEDGNVTSGTKQPLLVPCY